MIRGRSILLLLSSGKTWDRDNDNVGVPLGGVEIPSILPSSFCFLTSLSSDRETDEATEIRKHFALLFAGWVILAARIFLRGWGRRERREYVISAT